eukprot:SAG22_NODE_596_length_8727_cov_107.360338_9_plen_651_part_00
MKEFQYGDRFKLPYLPVYIESFASSEAQFENRKHLWSPDMDDFETWESNKDVIDRVACSVQGVMAHMDLAHFVCRSCETTRDQICVDCSNPENAFAGPSGSSFSEALEQLSAYTHRQSRTLGCWDAQSTKVLVQAVHKAEVVILLVSNAYKISQACRTQAEHARKTGKHLIPVVVDTNFRSSDGAWLAALMGSEADDPIRLDGLDGSSEQSELAMQAILDRLGAHAARSCKMSSQRSGRGSRALSRQLTLAHSQSSMTVDTTDSAADSETTGGSSRYHMTDVVEATAANRLKSRRNGGGGGAAEKGDDGLHHSSSSSSSSSRLRSVSDSAALVRMASSTASSGSPPLPPPLSPRLQSVSSSVPPVPEMVLGRASAGGGSSGGSGGGGSPPRVNSSDGSGRQDVSTPLRKSISFGGGDISGLGIVSGSVGPTSTSNGNDNSHGSDNSLSLLHDQLLRSHSKVEQELAVIKAETRLTEQLHTAVAAADRGRHDAEMQTQRTQLELARLQAQCEVQGQAAAVARRADAAEAAVAAQAAESRLAAMRREVEAARQAQAAAETGRVVAERAAEKTSSRLALFEARRTGEQHLQRVVATAGIASVAAAAALYLNSPSGSHGVAAASLLISAVALCIVVVTGGGGGNRAEKEEARLL